MLPIPFFLFDALPTYEASHNTTLLNLITPHDLSDAPFYHVTRQHLLSWISDRHLSLLAPTLVYWVLSTLFEILDTAQLPYFERRRIHDSAEVKAKNRAQFWPVIRVIVFQQVIQAIVGLLILESDESILEHEVKRDHVRSMAYLAPRVADGLFLLLGQTTGMRVLQAYGPQLVSWVYWWGIPSLQMYLAFFLMDSWQYWLHRTLHVYPTLYRQIHSQHHRLYVPFAFGAQYQHPLEGLLLDTLGAGGASILTFMTVRQATLLFVLSTWKTVDDHCGYRLWWDPCQMLFYNNADYHDIHHQAFGIKANFSQPFFTNWDVLLGTHMSRTEADGRRRSGVVVKED